MPRRDLTNIIKACQRKVGAFPDADPGEETWGKIYNALTGNKWDWTSNEERGGPVKPLPPVQEYEDVPKVDERSEKLIATLLPEVQPFARKLLIEAGKQGINLIVTSGTRTYAEQQALYDQGRSKPGKIVTHAKPGSSWHNHACAFDVTIFKDGQPVWESPLYKKVGLIGEEIGLEWGGRFESFSDEPHFHRSNGKSLAEARRLHEAGKTVFT